MRTSVLAELLVRFTKQREIDSSAPEHKAVVIEVIGRLCAAYGRKHQRSPVAASN